MQWFVQILGLVYFAMTSMYPRQQVEPPASATEEGTPAERAAAVAPGKRGGRCRRAVKPLDPIDKSLPGRARTKQMLAVCNALSLTILQSALTFITCDDPTSPAITTHLTAGTIDSIKGGPTRWTCSRYNDHLDTLVSSGIVEELTEKDIKEIEYWATYFSVPKNEEYDRSIFNGKLLSRLFNNPPNTSLFNFGNGTRRN